MDYLRLMDALILVQVAIAITSAIAIYLTNSKHDKFRKYAPIFGLLGEPFWIYTSYTNHQWGVMALALFYSYSWFIGLRNSWFK
ncbi:hypothetical protein I3271_05575 [Photobacterium leiognathi]|uniref:hypothetical protein n=1 Tax=Photobacterium leiognathi TaxID=553611 RepID=UPI001EE0977B|nr:hypothetical protein [Photobacterium leiognathi]MCG3884151.1 hypothetical protein [Photobacterium leiognathi]